jgi:hypothetical protein
MDQIIGHFDNLIINKNGNPPLEISLELRADPEIEHHAKTLGLYNGDILGCTMCKHMGKDVVIDCNRFKFYDVIFNRIKAEFDPQMVNVNAILKFKEKAQKKQEYTLLIKRPDNVYAYPDYWDFPAGLVPYDTPLRDRLVDRIESDTGIKESNLTIPEQPSLVVSRGKFFGLYYPVPCNISKEQIEPEIEKRVGKDNYILLKQNEIGNFLKENKKVYPFFLSGVFNNS